MTASFDIANGVLFMTGSLDRSTDQEMTQALAKYAKTVPPADRVVDMSNVRWLAPTGGKALIAAGQETSGTGGSLRVLASRHVLQTLNLLGAKAWLNIESCQTPNPLPGTAEQEAAAAESPQPAEPEPSEAHAAHATAAVPASAAPRPGAAGPAESGEASSKPAVTTPASVHITATGAHPGGIYVSPHEDLVGGAALLRALTPNRRYSFHLHSGELMLGFARERVGGPWIVVEIAGARKLLNLDHVEYCEAM
jgi:anti-anti-sigma regulatory factor